jgi:hypothetical protein
MGRKLMARGYSWTLNVDEPLKSGFHDAWVEDLVELDVVGRKLT